MPAYRSGLDAARAMKTEAQDRVDELVRALPKDYQKDLPERMVAELEAFARDAKPKDETAEAYRDAESVLTRYERKLGEARDIVAQVRGARRRGERFVHPGRMKRVLLGLCVTAGIAAIGFGAISAWNAHKEEERVGAGIREVAAGWESLKYCLIGNADGDVTRRLLEIEAELPTDAPQGSDSWPRRCVRHVDTMIEAATAAKHLELVRTLQWARQELAEGGLRSPETLWSSAQVIEQLALGEGDAVPPPPARKVPIDALTFRLPIGEVRTEAFQGDAVRVAILGTTSQQCELSPKGVRCETIAGRQWIDFTMGPSRPEMMALTAFEGSVSVATLPTKGMPTALAESASLSGVHVAAGGEILGLFEALNEKPASFLLLQRKPGAELEKIAVENTGSLVWDQIITLSPTPSPSVEPSLSAQGVDLTKAKLLPEIELGKLPSIDALVARHGESRTWSWLSSCHTNEGSFLVVGAPRRSSVLEEDDMVPAQIAWHDSRGWEKLITVPERLPRGVLGRVTCTGHTATWTGLTERAVVPSPEAPPALNAPLVRKTYEAWQMRCDPKTCGLTRSPELTDLESKPVVILTAGEHVLLFETELRESKFWSTPVETVWMRRSRLEDLAKAPRIRVTDSIALGRPIDGLDAFARADLAYLLLTSNGVRSVIAIDPNGQPRALPSL